MTTASPAETQPQRPLDPQARKRLHAATRALLDELIAAFPAAFKPHGTPGLPPLAIGIETDILARLPHIDAVLLKRALGVYASGPEYFRSVIAGRPRVDLDGAVVQQIADEDKSDALRRLDAFENAGHARQATLADALSVLDDLVASFPACFKPREARGRPPLKIGVHADILARRPDLDRAALAKALKIYATGPDYLRSAIAGLPRVDLDGATVQEISDEEKINAQYRLADRFVHLKARKERQAQAQKESPQQPDKRPLPPNPDPQTNIAAPPKPHAAPTPRQEKPPLQIAKERPAKPAQKPNASAPPKPSAAPKLDGPRRPLADHPPRKERASGAAARPSSAPAVAMPAAAVSVSPPVAPPSPRRRPRGAPTR